MSVPLTDALLRSQSDPRLLALARDGHERAFDALVERHLGPLLKAARPLVGDDRATEIVQEAARGAWRELGAGVEVVEVAGWLHRVVRRTAWSETAGPDADPLAAELASALDPLAIARRREAFDALVVRLGALPDDKRDALVALVTERCSREAPGGSLALGASEVVASRLRSTGHALATSLTPAAAASWAARQTEPSAGERLARTLTGVGSRGRAGVLGRAAAIVVVAGAMATGFAAREPGVNTGEPAADRAASAAPSLASRRAATPSARGGTRAAGVAGDARPSREAGRRAGGPVSVASGGAEPPVAARPGAPDRSIGSGGTARPTGTRPPEELARRGSRGSATPRSADGVERGTTGAGGMIGRGPSLSPGSISPGSGGVGTQRPKPANPSPSSPPPSHPSGPSGTPAPAEGQSAPAPVSEAEGGIPVVVR